MRRLIKPPLFATVAATAALVLLIPLCISFADATIDSPVPVASITDGQTHSNGKTFDELRRAWAVTTVNMDSSTYALVVAYSDHGVQIIDITNPANPVPVASITDGQTHSNGKTFDELRGARAITTVDIGISTYALVASYNDRGVQIIDITNPASPAPVASFDDEDTVTVGNATKTFDELRGARGITTVNMDSSTYALVAAYFDDGVQIINITDPANPVPTASFDNGDRVPVNGTNRTFHLDGAWGITTVNTGTSTYALVTAEVIDAVQIVDITDPENPVPTTAFSDGATVTVNGTDRTFDELDGVNDITTVDIGTSTYALIAAEIDNGVQIVDITDPENPVPTASFENGTKITVNGTDRTFDELINPRGITTATIGTSTYALVAAYTDDGVQIVDITDPANPVPTTSFDDGDTVTVNGTTKTFDELDGARGITTVDIGTSTYALVAAYHDDGVQIVDISSRSIANQPTVAPTLTSVERHDPATQDTNDNTPTFRVTFSEAVNNVDESDFETTGSATATVSAVTPVPGGTVYHVEVTVTEDGIVRLGIATANDIKDVTGNALSGTTPAGADEPYTIDTVAPTLASVTRHSPTDEDTSSSILVFRAAFSEAVANVDEPDFVILGNSNMSEFTVTPVPSSSNSTYEVRVFVLEDGTVELGINATANDIKDAAGNALSDTEPTGDDETYTVDNVRPTLTSVKRHEPFTENTNDTTPTFRVTFSEAVNSVDTSDFVTTGNATATVSTVVPLSGGTAYHVGVTVTANGTVGLSISPARDIEDAAGNNVRLALPTGDNELYNVLLLPQAENRPPTITLNGDNPATAERYATYTDAGAACADDDGDGTTLTNSSNVDTDTIQPDPYRYTYSCTDEHGLAATNVTRAVHVEDTVTPVLSLNGLSSVSLTVGDPYTEEGATCTDSGRPIDVGVGGATVDTAVAGQYGVIYTCSDGYNRANPVTRTVTVTEPAITPPPPPPPPPDGNVPPTASISAPSRAAEGTQVTLDGTGSADTDGTIQSYNWTAGNPAVTITGGNQETASFTAPQVAEDTSLLITLKVTDDYGATGSAQHNMTITDTNQPPDGTTPPPPNEPPVISYTVNPDSSGPDSITLDRDTGFDLADLGVTCSDPEDGDITPVSENENLYDPTTEDSQSILYSCTDSDNNTVYLRVVLNLSAPDTTSDDDNEHKTRPTFGNSWSTNQKLVSCGYSMDGSCHDVLAYHVDYQRAEIRTGSTHDFALKAYAEKGLDRVAVGFGVPSVGSPFSDAEASITVHLGRNYTTDSTYEVAGISHDVRRGSTSSVIDASGITASVDSAACMSDVKPGAAATTATKGEENNNNSNNDYDCISVLISGVLFLEQTYDEPFMIQAVDSKRRVTNHYMNDGLAISGESLNPLMVILLQTKYSSQSDIITHELVRTDKINDVWTDQFGYTWTKNSYGTWHYLEGPAHSTGTACTDVNNRLCDAFAAKMAGHTALMEQLRDAEYGDIYQTQ